MVILNAKNIWMRKLCLRFLLAYLFRHSFSFFADTKSKAADWLKEVDMAVNNQFPSGFRNEIMKRGYELNLMANK